MSKRFRAYYHQLDKDRSPSALQKTASAVSTAAIIGAGAYAAFLGGRVLARTGALEKAGDYILAASDTTNYMMRHRFSSLRPKDMIKETKEAFTGSLHKIQQEASERAVNIRMTEVERLLRKRHRFSTRGSTAGLSNLTPGEPHGVDGVIERVISKSVREGKILQENADNVSQRMAKEMDDAILRYLEGKSKPGVSSFLLGEKALTIEEAARNKLFSDEVMEMISALEERTGKSVQQFRADPYLFVSKRGRVRDYTSWSHIHDRTLNWWSNTIVGQIGGFSHKLAKKHTPFFHTFGGEEDGYHPVMRYIEDLVRKNAGEEDVTFLERKLRDRYLVAGDRVISLYDENIVVDGIELVGGRTGPYARMLRNMGHLDSIGRGDTPHTTSGRLASVIGMDAILDIGYQDSPSAFHRASSNLLKGTHPDYIPNIIKQMGTDQSITYGQFNELYRFMNQNIGGLDGDLLNLLGQSDLVHPIFSKYDFASPEDILRAVIDISELDGLDSTANLKRLAQTIKDDPYGFLQRTQVHTTEGLFGTSVTRQSGEYLARKELTHVALSNLVGGNFQDVQSSIFNNPKVYSFMGESRYQRAMDAISLVEFNVRTEAAKNAMDYAKRNAKGSHSWKKEKLHEDVQEALRAVFFGETTKPFQDDMQTIVRRHAGFFSAGPIRGYPDEQFIGLGTDYTVIRKSQFLPSLKSGDVSGFFQSFRELTAGRHNLGQVTSATRTFYDPLQRMSDLLGTVGMGLSSKSMDSVTNLAWGIFGKRMLAGYGAMWAGRYLSYELERSTGYGIGQRYWRAVAQLRMDLAQTSDDLGLTERRKRMRELMPGIERLQHLPLVGWTMQPVRSAEELHEYFMTGERPVREGRWWRLGSNTPYVGSKTSYYLPNEYIMGTTPWQHTDTLYGDQDEYWSRSWIPTPRYPLSTVKALLDPYWLERKHEKDRPYPMTGELFEENMPFGPLLNSTVGRLIKPPRRMHQKEIRDYQRNLKKQGQQTRTLPQGSAIGFVRDGKIIPQHFMPAFPDAQGMEIVGQTYEPLRADDYGGTPQGFYAYGQHPSMDYANEAMYFQGSYTPVAGAYQQSSVMPEHYGTGESLFYVPSTHDSTDTFLERFKKPTRRQQISNAALTFLGLKEETKSRQVVQAMNEGIIQRRGMFGAMIEDVERPPYIDTSHTFNPYSLGYKLSSMRHSTVKLFGIRGFLFDTVTGGDPYRLQTKIATSSDMYSKERLIGDANLGDVAGDLSEVYRRFLPSRTSTIKRWNPIRNTMPSWLPGPEHYTDYLHGDPYTQIEHGEVRLPGEAYESVRTLHSDPWFGEYGAFERFKILADVAPSSDQYKIYRDTVRQMLYEGMLPQEWKAEYETILDQVKERNIRYEKTPYKFQIALQNDWHTVTVTDYIDANTFMTEEFPDNPIRLAGLKMAEGSHIADVVAIGEKVRILTANEKSGLVNQDSLQTISATLFSGDANLNRQFIDMGMAEETDDESVAGIWTKYSPSEIRFGAGYESLSHFNIPVLHNRFLGIHSPLEYYKRRHVYGKERQSWNPAAFVKDIITPTMQSFASLDPLEATARGAFAGALIGKMFFGGGSRTRGGAIIVGTVALAMSTGVSIKEAITGEKWIPKRRKKEHQTLEYFDMLEYVKYKGLYEQAAHLAEKKEGVNIDYVLDTLAEEERESIAKRSELEERKRQLTIEGAHHNQQQIMMIEEKLRELETQHDSLPLEPYTLQAVKYRSKYESTLYGMDLDRADYREIFRALPERDRDFYEEFVKETDPQKRKEILELIPRNQRRIYQKAWGMEVDDLPDIASYFDNHYLPEPGWLGWDPEIDLDLFKVKYVASEGMDMQAMGVWEGDKHDADNIGIPTINPFQSSVVKNRITNNLSQILRGAGMKHIVIDVVENPHPGISIQLDIIQDRQEELQQVLTSMVGGI